MKEIDRGFCLIGEIKRLSRGFNEVVMLVLIYVIMFNEWISLVYVFFGMYIGFFLLVR